MPVPSGLTGDLVASLDYPMYASESRIRDLVPDPPGGLLTVREAIGRALSGGTPRPVNRLTDPHHLADTDPDWAGGDVARIRLLGAATVSADGWEQFERLGASLLLSSGPAAGAVRGKGHEPTL